MEHQILFNICGWVASIDLILGYLPQAIQTIRTRNTDGISLPGFHSFVLLGSVCHIVAVWKLLIEYLG